MGFFDKMKRAMGFSHADDEELETEGIDATVTPLRQRTLLVAEDERGKQGGDGGNRAGADVSSVVEIPAQDGENVAHIDVSSIFEGVVRVFNEALPTFLRGSVDPEKQRQLLFETLDKSTKEYFDNLEKSLERRLNVRYQAESRKLQEQIEELRLKARKDEEENTNAKNLQLSAERQKRALSERVHELEKQLASIEAENEQYILENKSMANKLRLASVTDRDADAAGARKAVSEKEEQVAALQAELDDTKEQLSLVTARLSKAQDDLQVVREVQEQVRMLEESQRVNDAELRRQKDELMEKDELIRAKDADLLTKNTTLRIKDETIRRLEDQTDSLRKSIEAAQFEKTQTESALRSEIERLKNLKGVAAPPAGPDTAVDGEGMENQVVPEAESEPDLTLDLPELVSPESAVVTTPRPRRGRPPKPRAEAGQDTARTVAVRKKTAKQEEDDSDLSLLESTDWLIASPSPDSLPKQKRQHKQKNDQADDAFGYKEPVRQEPPDNPAQMLLW